MTISGAVNRTGILLICAVLTAAWSWNRFTVSPETAGLPLMIGLIGGLVVAVVTIFKKEWAPATAPLYALLEGLVLGSVSAMYEARFHGIAIQAVGLTFGTLFALLVAYRAGVIRATEKLKVGVSRQRAASRSFMLRSLCSAFSVCTLPQSMDQARLGSGSVCCGHRCCAEPGARLRFHREWRAFRTPKYMEWYAAFG